MPGLFIEPAHQGEMGVFFPMGSVVKVVAHFDNSEHPRNPTHPPMPVSYGFGANDEMCEGFCVRASSPWSSKIRI